jgi:hypothetical protein
MSIYAYAKQFTEFFKVKKEFNGLIADHLK